MNDFSLLLYNIKSLLPLRISRALPKEIVVISISSKKSQKLNHIFRKKNKPTNVLSFFYTKEYGEILICPAIIRREAKEAGNTYLHQMTWMIVHGMLHLAGLHHEKSQSLEKKFTCIENEIINSKRKMQSAKVKT